MMRLLTGCWGKRKSVHEIRKKLQDSETFTGLKLSEFSSRLKLQQLNSLENLSVSMMDLGHFPNFHSTGFYLK